MLQNKARKEVEEKRRKEITRSACGAVVACAKTIAGTSSAVADTSIKARV